MYKSSVLILLVFFLSCTKSDDVHSVIELPAPIGSKTYSSIEVAGFKQLAFNTSTGDQGFIKKW